MPSFMQQQSLEYREHKDEMEVLARAIDLLGNRDSTGALEVLVARHAYLIESQSPRLKDYDQREELGNLRS